jgi:NitT/TauT family transport system substrate-binding protein
MTDGGCGIADYPRFVASAITRSLKSMRVRKDMRMKKNPRLAIRVCALLCALSAATGMAAAQAITVGVTSSTSDAPIFIADKKGYFRDEGLDVKVVNFRSAADMVAPLGAGQIEAGAGSASAGLYNAVARGIKIKIVADKASSAPGYGATKILVRKDHVESGRYRELKDLKGMKFAMNAPGVSNTSTLNTLLKSAGLQYADVETVDMPLPDHVAALKNKSVDASASVEPGPALAVRNGDAVVIKSDDEILPNHQIAVLLYSEDFAAKQPAAARAFMRAYIRAVRFYNGALTSGRLDGPNADEVIAILADATPIKSREIYKLITPTGMNPDGRVNKESLAYDLAFYAEQGLVKGAVNLDDAVDGSFVDAALKELGPYRP